MKEIWEVRPEAHRLGQVTHTMGWPLGKNAGGGSFMYHAENNQVFLGFVVHLNYENPWLYPYMEFQRFKHHPLIAEVLKGGKRVAYGARAITEGGWQSIPKLTFPGGALIGCSAGFVNVPRIKGNHNAMLSGIAAAEAAQAAIAAGRQGDELAAYAQAVATGPIAADLKPVRNVKPMWSRWGMFPSLAFGGLDMWMQQPDRQPLAVRDDEARQDRRRRHPARRSISRRSTIRSPTACSRFDRLTNVAFSFTNHAEDQPCHLRLKEPWIPIDDQPAALRRAGAALLPGRGLRGGARRRRLEPAVRDQLPELRALQDLRHQGSAAEHRLGDAAGRRRAELPQHVTGGGPRGAIRVH